MSQQGSPPFAVHSFCQVRSASQNTCGLAREKDVLAALGLAGWNMAYVEHPPFLVAIHHMSTM